MCTPNPGGEMDYRQYCDELEAEILANKQAAADAAASQSATARRTGGRRPHGRPVAPANDNAGRSTERPAWGSNPNLRNPWEHASQRRTD